MTCRHPKAARAARVIADRLVTACWACEVEREIWRSETFPRSLDTPIGYTETVGSSDASVSATMPSTPFWSLTLQDGVAVSRGQD